MNSLRRAASVLAVSAVAALFGASCASLNEPVNDADDTKPGDQTSDEQTGEVRQPLRPRPYGGGGYGGCYGIPDGLYCGGDMVSGDPNTLYQCVRGVKYFARYCGGWGYPPYYPYPYGDRDRRPYGGGGSRGNCVWEPPGVPDRCWWSY